jgi:hypothetical protein
MANVLECIADFNDSGGAQADLGSGGTVALAWAHFEVYFDSTFHDTCVTESLFARLFYAEASGTGLEADSVVVQPIGGVLQWSTHDSGGFGAATANAWHSIDFKLQNASGVYSAALFIDGVNVGAISPLHNTSWTTLRWFSLSADTTFANLSDPAGHVYFRNFTLGTTQGASDLFDMGTLTTTVVPPFTSAEASGTYTKVTSDPAPALPHGVALGFSNGPLDDPVTWTRIDNLDGVMFESIHIKRGRENERDKTIPGVVTIQGKDTKGALDPTNPAGAYYGSLLPVKQASVSLYNPDTAAWSYLFRGYVDTLHYTRDPSGKWFEVELTFTDMLDMLNDGEVQPDQAGNTVPTESTGDCYYTGQHIDDRILAVLADSSTAFMAQVWPATLIQTASGNVFVQGTVYSRGTSLLQVIDDACDAEYPGSTNRFITSNGAFAFRGRFYRFVPTAFIPLDNTTRVPGTEMLHWIVGDIASVGEDASLAVYQNMEFEISKTDLINVTDVTPKGITDAQLAGTSQLSSDSTSITDYGPRTSGMSLENLITDNADDGNTALEETSSFAAATVQNYKDPPVYCNQLVFRNPVKGDPDYSNRWKLLCGIELSDLMTVWSKHPWGGGFNPTSSVDQDHYVESIEYELAGLGDKDTGNGDVWDVTLTVTLSSRHHFRWMPTTPVDGHYSNGWQPPAAT